ncbi:pyruvate/2-oxoglutarate dehydrogenase complex, dihydrolipoamide dehydrogenase component [Synechococcus sp. PCC 7502]|uniref:mercuric reductase n=1 Tax=Synechococcus sp. PCC 7502 TaxID=1173263 RepID=UPI00029FEE48|nr:mercuric reductase [Synechococcus sp. PCC 7502]AFY73014.1 pyruvate/2-oxoglutarate dehydrogenase complex, dihydrolipoamide dehydrogenase component [Synechococcus sp. PCC 7502]
MPNSPESLIQPLDRYNQALLNHVHPLDWQNPDPAKCYDLVVIGAGTAGLVVAAGAAGLGLGLKIALIEKHLMGGDCLNVGCVPSKALIRVGRAVAEIQAAHSFGIDLPEAIAVNFDQVMERMRRLRASISENDSVQRFQQLGIDVFLGSAQFINTKALEVNGLRLNFKKAVIATGARATDPQVSGLLEAGFLTNESVFSLTTRPKRLAVIGGGAIGCELAQTFQRLGSEVTLIHRNPRLLNREDADAAAIIQERLAQEGVTLILGANLERVEKKGKNKAIFYQQNGVNVSLEVDEILVGVGRSPNVEGLNLETADVAYNQRQGVIVNDYLQTTNPAIYAAGDICMNWKFTHAADAAARIVLKNLLFSPFGLGRSKLSNLVMPWVTFTDPEVAHVGLYAAEAHALGLDTNEIKIPCSAIDRAILDDQTAGFVKILYQQGSDRILGATIVASHAGEMLSEITLAIATKQGLNRLSGIIHAYPTQAEGIKKAADAYRKTLLTDRTRSFLKFLTWFS